MNLLRKTSHSKESSIESGLVIAQAEYLKGNLYVANIGTSSVILLLTYFYWGQDLLWDLIPWLGMGLLSAIFRSVLMWSYRKPQCFQDNPIGAKRYLHLYTAATLTAGITFGYGWLSLVPHLSSYEQLIYLLSIVALLFGGLFAYSPYLPAYIGFSATALWLSPLLLDFTSEIYIAGLAFGIWLISLVSTMFAVRFSSSFKLNKELEFNVLRLLGEVTQKRDEAIDANLAKSRFLASVSHDLRQPMQAVSLSLNTLEQLILHKAGGERAQQLVEDNLMGLQHSVQYLNSMFEALLDISRLDAGALSVKIEFQEIETLLKSLEYEYAKVAQEEGLRFEVITPKNFAKYLVKVDIHLLQRLLRNLIANAIRYTTKGGVRVAARIQGDTVDIRVVDTGLGIPMAMRAKIFDEFIQIRSPLSKDRNVGMGLGLSIARRLSGILGSRIRLHTHEHLGSVFAFKLVARRILSSTQAGYSNINVDASLESIDGALVVVIDDDPKICEASKTMLELHGAEVIVAESSDSAIQQMIFSSRMPNLILSDYRLGAETGLECVDRIRNEYNEDIPALIITGDTAPEELTLLKGAGMTVLYKPVQAEALLKKIADNIRK